MLGGEKVFSVELVQFRAATMGCLCSFHAVPKNHCCSFFITKQGRAKAVPQQQQQQYCGTTPQDSGGWEELEDLLTLVLLPAFDSEKLVPSPLTPNEALAQVRLEGGEDWNIGEFVGLARTVYLHRI